MSPAPQFGPNSLLSSTKNPTPNVCEQKKSTQKCVSKRNPTLNNMCEQQGRILMRPTSRVSHSFVFQCVVPMMSSAINSASEKIKKKNSSVVHVNPALNALSKRAYNQVEYLCNSKQVEHVTFITTHNNPTL